MQPKELKKNLSIGRSRIKSRYKLAFFNYFYRAHSRLHDHQPQWHCSIAYYDHQTIIIVSCVTRRTVEESSGGSCKSLNLSLTLAGAPRLPSFIDLLNILAEFCALRFGLPTYCVPHSLRTTARREGSERGLAFKVKVLAFFPSCAADTPPLEPTVVCGAALPPHQSERERPCLFQESSSRPRLIVGCVRVEAVPRLCGVLGTQRRTK